MLKGIGAIFSALFIAVLGAFLLPLVQPLATRLGNGDRAVANIWSGPWRELPGSKSAKSSNQMSDWFVKKVGEDERFPFYRIEITNPGSKSISDISIRLEDQVGDGSRYEVVGVDGKTVPTGPPDQIRIGTLTPGQRVHVYIWSVYDLYGLHELRDIKTYSSQGPLAVHFRGYDSSVDSPFRGSLWNVALVIYVGISSLFIVLACFRAMIQYHSYVFALMHRPSLYERERARFLKSRVGYFQPDLKEAKDIRAEVAAETASTEPTA